MSSTLEKLSGTLTCYSKRINQTLFIIATLAAAFMVIPTVMDVVFRYTFSRSLIGATELVEFSLAILVFGSLGFLQDNRKHIRVDLIVEHFSRPTQKALELFSTLCPFFFIAVMSWCMYRSGVGKLESGDVSALLNIPYSLFIFFGAFGAAAFALSLLANAFEVAITLFKNRYYYHALAGLAMTAFVLSLSWLISGTELAESSFLLGTLGMLFIMALILIGMPMGLAMTVVGFIGMLVFYPTIASGFSMLGVSPFNTSSNYIFSVVPMFILMGELAMHSGISRDLFSTANIWLGRLPGGLAVASVVGCAGFAAVSGDSMATAVTMGSVALPEMRKKKYEPAFACAALAAGGTLGILIPPSTGFIFYALVTETSIGQLFVAGIIPGLLLTFLLSCGIFLFSKWHPDLAPCGESSTFVEKVKATKGVIGMLALISLILGGILLGWFTPNEGGAVGAAGTLLYALARRRLSWRNLWSALTATTRITTSLLLILIGVGVLNYFFAATGLPTDLANAVVQIDASRYFIFAAIVAFYIVMGCLMNVIPMILLTLPAIFPSVVSLGFDPIWFGVVVVVLMETGQVTPPVGVNVFALASMAPDVPMAGIFKRIIPFVLAELGLILLLVIFPSFATWLPSLLF